MQNDIEMILIPLNVFQIMDIVLKFQIFISIFTMENLQKKTPKI